MSVRSKHELGPDGFEKFGRWSKILPQKGGRRRISDLESVDGEMSACWQTGGPLLGRSLDLSRFRRSR